MIDRIDHWEGMRAGNVAEALRGMREQLDANNTPSYVMQLGAALMWLHEYESAFEHFDCANQVHPKLNAGFYGMAGAAKWCLGHFDEAVVQWHHALSCEFADVAGGARAPLLLYVAAAMRPEVMSMNEACELLSTRSRDPRVRNWPGPLVELVLGKVDEAMIRSQCFVDRFQEVLRCHLWEADFYLSVIEYAQGHRARIDEMALRTAALSWNEFDEYRRSFLGLLWREEFHIARQMASF